MWVGPNKVKVKFTTFGYIGVTDDLIYSPSTNFFHARNSFPIFHTQYVDEAYLSVWKFYLIRGDRETQYHRNQDDVIFMRGMHKFQLECELVLEFSVEVKKVGTTEERISFKNLTVLDDDWLFKLTVEGPTASSFTYQDSQYFQGFMHHIGPWVFTGYKSATITVNNQTRNTYHSQYSKPIDVVALSPYEMIADIIVKPILRRMKIYFDNFEIELKRFDYRRNEWIDYPVRLATEHTVVASPLPIIVDRYPIYREPTQPVVDRNKITVNEGNLQQGVFDEFVYDVVERTVGGITLPVRLSWLPLLGDGDILQTEAPWFSSVRYPDTLYDPTWHFVKLYDGFGYRHYAAPIVNLHVREISDLGHELNWSYKWGEANWPGTPIVRGTMVYEKKPPSPDIYTRPRHISKIEVAPTQLGLIVDINPRDAWVW